MADLRALLWPIAVAVIGASPDAHLLRGRILHGMRQHPFARAISPISRSHEEVQGLKASASLADLPERVDLAMMLMPAPFVPDALECCGEAGVQAAPILTSGFAEATGSAGVAALAA